MTLLHVISPTQMKLGETLYPIAIGKGGFVANKKEGDHATPIGEFALRECWYRADKLSAPQTGLPTRQIHPDDGWCDDPAHDDYNRHVKFPFTASHEHLWREDDRYDLIVPLGYNDDPPIAGHGSAIFMHIAAPDYEGTEGCVALSRVHLLEVLAKVDEHSRIVIAPETV